MLNSTLLHELYFASLGGDGRAVPETMAEALAHDFGSPDRWRQEFIMLANALAGGSGWVLLTYVPRDGRLINQRRRRSRPRTSPAASPILALDMYEHAYHIDLRRPTPRPMSRPSCATSTGPQSRAATRMRPGWAPPRPPRTEAVRRACRP